MREVSVPELPLPESAAKLLASKKELTNTHTKEEVALMAEYMGYKSVPEWIFMGALNDWHLSSRAILSNAKEWERQGKPIRSLNLHDNQERN
jgi:hypothetical protein